MNGFVPVDLALIFPGQLAGVGANKHPDVLGPLDHLHLDLRVRQSTSVSLR